MRIFLYTSAFYALLDGDDANHQAARGMWSDLVDCVSFEIMRSAGIRTVFAFHRHFRAQAFTLIP